MSQATILLELDPAKTLSDESVEPLLRNVVAKVAPHLLTQVGAIDFRHGETSGTAWTTEGWLADGTYLSLGIEVGSSQLKLFIDTSPVLKPPAPPWGVREKMGLSVVVAGFALASGWYFRSVLAILGGIVASVVVWTALEIGLTIRKEKAAAARVIDEVDWRRRLLAVIE